jgi:hypothetical protein
MTHTSTTTVDNRDTACEAAPAFGWNWPDETRLAAFAAEADREEEADRMPENSAEYAALYFVS